MQRHAKYQTGIGVVEVLVAAAIFALGVLAVVKLQGEFLRGSGDADARAIAVQMAQQKIDDLRRFVSSTADPARFDFTDIASNAGGNIAAGSSTVGNVAYALSWTVTDNYYADTNNDGAVDLPPTTTPSGAVAQKLVTVTVNWTDRSGAAQSVRLTDIIDSLSPAAAAGLSAGPGSGVASTGPQAHYTSSTSPGVVPVGVGKDAKRETLVPTVSGGQVKFTAYTYNATGVLLRQEDFTTVGCTCTLSGTAGSGRTAAHAVWKAGSINSFRDVDGDVVTKDVGTPANNQQDPMCDACCRDHHDPGAGVADTVKANPATSDPLTSGGGDGVADNLPYCDPASGVFDRCYDPFRDAGGTDDFSNGKHVHYTANGAVAGGGQDYVESCRMKRVDGYWRVYQDWHRVDVQAFQLADKNGTDVFTGTVKNDYAGYVGHIIDDLVVQTQGGASFATFYGQSLSVGSLTQPIGQKTSANPLQLLVGDKVQMTARAVYVDYLSAALLSAVRAQKAAGSDYLINVPFYEVEVTDRAPTCTDSPTPSTDSTYSGGWCRPTGTSSVAVGSVGQGANALNAGQIQGQSDSGGQRTVTFDFRRSNSGLTGSSSPADVNSNAKNRDRLKDRANVVVQVMGSSTATVTLTVSLSGGSPNKHVLSFTDAYGTTQCTGTGTFTCPVHYGVAGTLNYSGSNSTQTCTGSGSYGAMTQNGSYTLPIVCTTTVVNYPLTITFTYTNNTKADTMTSVTATDSNGNSVLSGSCTPTTQGQTITGLACHVTASSGTITFAGSSTSGKTTASCSGSGKFSGATTSGGNATVTVTCQ